MTASSSLDFLSPDRARSDLGFRPLLRSSMERLQRDAGATFAERDGWLVSVSLPGESEHAAAGIADLSHMAKFEARGRGEAVSGEGIVWHQVSPERAIVLCPYAQSGWLRDRLERAFPFVLDQTGALAILVVAGPSAPLVMRRITHLHEFPASGDVSHVAAHVLERDGCFWIVFPQEYGHYLWELAVDAAGQLGGGPVGVDAIAGGRP
jgi:glycine cleavage system aminomethyltransferase T